MLTGKWYDYIKFVAQIGLPSLTTLYFGIASIWGIPDTANVIGTMTVVDTFLGAILGISSLTYQPPVHGTVVVDDRGLKTVQLPGMTAEDIAAQDTITLKVKPETSLMT